MKTSDMVRYLDIIFDRNMTMGSQANECAAKAGQGAQQITTSDGQKKLVGGAVDYTGIGRCSKIDKYLANARGCTLENQPEGVLCIPVGVCHGRPSYRGNDAGIPGCKRKGKGQITKVKK